MRMIFVNLPVKDLQASQRFFTEIGFEFHLEFSDDTAACMTVDQNIFVMLLAEDRFRDFINGDISDATRTTEVLTCLSADSKEHVDETIAKGSRSGREAVEADDGAGRHVWRKLPGPRRSRLGAHAHGAAVTDNRRAPGCRAQPRQIQQRQRERPASPCRRRNHAMTIAVTASRVRAAGARWAVPR
jgi:uncharacterized protein